MDELQQNQMSNADLEGTFEGCIQHFMHKTYERNPDKIDILLFAERYLELKVVYANFAGPEGNRPEGYLSLGDGAIQVLEKGRAVYKTFPIGTVVLEEQLRVSRRTEDYRRLRFTLAHECAHWILDTCKERTLPQPDFPVRTSMDRWQQAQDLKEWQANRGAAILLMPRFLVTDALKELHGEAKVVLYGDGVLDRDSNDLVQRLADRMEVNYMPMRYRLGELELYEEHPMEEMIESLLARMHAKFPS